MQEKVIITCALTGAGPLSDNPNQPITPEQIANSGLEAAAAGAAILHVHVRDLKTGEMSGELDLYREAVSRIRASNKEVILNLTTGLGSGYVPSRHDPAVAGPGTHMWSAEKRIEHVLDLKPEICTLDLVTGQVFGVVVMSLEPIISRMAVLAREAGVTPEIELFDTGDAVLAKQMIKNGVLDGPGMYSFVMGLNYAMPATVEMMTLMRNMLPAGAQWQGFGIGRNQFPMAAASCLLGGHVRVGMEDNVYISKGVFADSNAALVKKAKRMVSDLGPGIATPGEARAILGLKTPPASSK